MSVYKYSDLDRHVEEFRSQGKAGKVNAAGICAMFVVELLDRLQFAVKQTPRAETDEFSSRVIAGIIRADVAPLQRCHTFLKECLADDTWIELTRMHEHPVRVGDLVAGSYIEAACVWANGWALAFASTHATLRASLNGELAQPNCETVLENWSHVVEFLGDKDQGDIAKILLVGIAKEMNRLSEIGYVTTAVAPPVCRLEVRSDKSGDFIVLDGTRYPVSEPAAVLVREAIATRDWVSGKSLEPECRSRHIDNLPPEIQSLIVRKVPLGYRLSPDAWL